MIAILLWLLIIGVPLAWLYAELLAGKTARIALGIATVIVLAIAAEMLGHLGGEFESNDYFARPTKKLLTLSIAHLEKGESQQVLQAWRNLESQYHPNYETRSHFQELVADAIITMDASATQPASSMLAK